MLVVRNIGRRLALPGCGFPAFSVVVDVGVRLVLESR
jgi:hypothetical protein